MNIIKILKEIINENQLTQTEFAKLIEVKPPLVTEWLKGKAKPEYDNLRKIAIKLNVSGDYLLGLEDDYGNKINTAKYYNSFNNSNINNSNFK